MEEDDSILLINDRSSRSGDRRVWNINCNKMGKGEAEQYIKQLVQRHKNKKPIYNEKTGEIINMCEEYWFGKPKVDKIDLGVDKIDNRTFMQKVWDFWKKI
jgi:hypothetical protein